MKITVLHGSPRKGNTYFAANIFMDELSKCGNAEFTEFYFPDALPVFCAGCTLCLGGKHESCPNARYTAPILDAILNADALVFTTPHYGACSMPGAMKTLFDHIDFLVLNVAPNEKMFDKRAIVITTGAGSTAAVKPIKNYLKHSGVNRVYSLGLRLLTDKWSNMRKPKQERFEKKLRRSAVKFYNAPKGKPYLSTVLFYHMSKFILKRFVGSGNFAYENWKAKGYFDKRPF